MIYKHPQPRSTFCFVLIIQLLLPIFNTSCNEKKASFENPPGYDLSKPYQYKLPTILDEISGIIFYPKDSSVFAIQDEKGFLFKIHFKNPLEVEKWKFSTGADYEDLALVDSSFYVLKSKGLIEKLQFSAGDSLTLQSYKMPEYGRNEFETIFYDSSLHRLIVMCKNCEDDTKKEVGSWAFDPSTNSFSTAFNISTLKIKEQLKDEKFKFKPSAGAIHPVTGELYVLSSIGKALVIFNKDHTVKNSYRIDPKLFKQPEGMTFTPKGDLIISNEAANSGAADILIFKYHKPNNEK